MRIINYLVSIGLVIAANTAFAAPDDSEKLHQLPEKIICSGHTANTCKLESRFFRPTANGDLYGKVTPGIYFFSSAQASFTVPGAPFRHEDPEHKVGYSLKYFYKNALGDTLSVLTSYQSTLTTTYYYWGWLLTDTGFECRSGMAPVELCPFASPY